MHRDGFSFFHGGKECSEEAGRVKVELNLDRSFSCLELLTFWTRSFFFVGAVLCIVGCGVDPWLLPTVDDSDNLSPA